LAAYAVPFWNWADGPGMQRVRLSKILYYLADNIQSFMLSEVEDEVKRKGGWGGERVPIWE